jgi:hypothetical protein
VPSPAVYVEAQLRVTDLATHRVRTIASGRISSPVYAGPYLIWGKISNTGAYSFQAVSADTLKPVVLPSSLGHPGSVSYLAGSPQYLAWSSQNYLSMTVWPIGSHRLYHITSQDTRRHFQFLQFAGHFVVWYGGTASEVLDLTTGKAFDLPGTLAGSPSRIVTAVPVSPPAAKGGTAPSRVSSIATPSAPSIRSCAKLPLAAGPTHRQP